VDELPETITLEQPGEWTEGRAGGRLSGKKGHNPYWCTNPQYFLNL